MTLICDLLTAGTYEGSHKFGSNRISTSYMTFDHMTIWKFLCYINKPSLVPIGLQFFNWDQFYIFSLSYNLTSYDLWPWYLSFDLINKLQFPCYIHKPSLFQIGLQLFNWGQFCIFSLSYNLTSYDLWPWYVNFDLIKKWGFPCCTYDSNSVEIHQSMQKLQANVNPFFTTENNNRQQWTKWSLCVFPAKAGDTKTHEFERFIWKFSGTSDFINISPWQTLW